jgi:hypothetical protein
MPVEAAGSMVEDRDPNDRRPSAITRLAPAALNNTMRRRRDSSNNNNNSSTISTRTARAMVTMNTGMAMTRLTIRVMVGSMTIGVTDEERLQTRTTSKSTTTRGRTDRAWEGDRCPVAEEAR